MVAKLQVARAMLNPSMIRITERRTEQNDGVMIRMALNFRLEHKIEDDDVERYGLHQKKYAKNEMKEKLIVDFYSEIMDELTQSIYLLMRDKPIDVIGRLTALRKSIYKCLDGV